MLVALLSPWTAFAAGTAVRGPDIPAATGGGERVTVPSGVVELNPARDTVRTDYGVESTTFIKVDATNGIMGGSAESNLDSLTTVPKDGVSVVSVAQGNLSSPITFSGAGTVTAELAFDGSFEVFDGTPTMFLIGNLTASSFAAIPFEQSLYSSQLSFTLSEGVGVSDPEWQFLSSESQTSGGVTTTKDSYAGAAFTVNSDTRDNLDGVVRLAFDVEFGRSYLINANITGLVSPQVDGETSTDFELGPSAGLVDFSNTATLSLFVPEGMVATGDPLLAQIVTTVPEPAAYAMMLGGLALVGTVARRQRRSVR